MAKTWKNPLRDALKVSKSTGRKNPSKEPPTVRFQPPRQTSSLQTPVEVEMNSAMLDNEALMLQIFGTGDANVTDQRHETVHSSAAPSRHTNHVVEGDSTASIGRTSETTATLTRPSSRNLSLSVKKNQINKQQKSKHRGLNKPGFATHYPEKLVFNTSGQAVAPRNKVAKYSRYIGILATDPSIFPINVKDYRTLRKLGLVDKAWKIVKDSIDWGYDENRAKEERIKKTVEKKLNDRWRKFKHVLHQEYYLPFIGDPERFECDDGRTDSEQYQKLVDIWDEGGYSEKRSVPNVINRKQLTVCHTAGSMTFAQMRYEWGLEHPGKVLDRSTFFKLAHTKKGKDGELPKAINEEAQQHFDMLDLLEQREYEAGKELTSKLKDQLFVEHFGAETQNGVRGYGIGVEWQDVPGVVIKNKGISHQVQELRAALEIANNKHEEAMLAVELAKAEVDKMKEATNLKEQKLEEDLNSIKRQMCDVSPLAGIFEGRGLESITSEALESLVTLLSEAARKKGSDKNNTSFSKQGIADSMIAI